MGASASLSPQLSTIIIALLLAAKMATGDYDEGERKGHNHNPESEEEVVVFNMCECVLTGGATAAFYPCLKQVNRDGFPFKKM